MRLCDFSKLPKILGLGVFVISAACTPVEQPIRADQATAAFGIGPPNAEDGICYGRDVSPAVVETVTQQVLAQPAQLSSDGTVLSPPMYRSETLQRIVTERKELWFEALCSDALTPALVSSVQRALAARDLYTGAITGILDLRTRMAIRRHQKAQGLDSALLSTAAARQLGLAPIKREER
ncbi:peptidoglycan-binding domain-containing protein [Nereida sp.]|uniref:peptidoglycan-binding domain-containing protein n=1 Tax=Nereida sp. TaxID=2736090 RepID=UPI003F697A35